VDPKIERERERERESQDSGLELYDQEVILGEGRVNLKRMLLANCWVAKRVNNLDDI